MKLDDLKAGWKTEIETTESKQDLTQIIHALEKETYKIDKSVKRRDFLEISIALLLIPVWVWQLFVVTGLMQTIALWILIIACLFIPYKMNKAKKIEAAKDNSVLAYLGVEKIKLENQKKLLESIAVWYISPLMLGIVLFTAGATVDESGVPQVSGQLATYYIFCGLLSVGGYLLNRRAAGKQFSPLLDKVNQQINELTELNEISELNNILE